MIDRKSRASGDENYEYEPEKKQVTPEIQEAVYAGKIKICEKCLGEYIILEGCKYCALFDEIECECGCKFGKHKVWIFREVEKSMCRECFGWHGQDEGWGRHDERPIIHELKAKRNKFVWGGIGYFR